MASFAKSRSGETSQDVATAPRTVNNQPNVKRFNPHFRLIMKVRELDAPRTVRDVLHAMLWRMLRPAGTGEGCAPREASYYEAGGLNAFAARAKVSPRTLDRALVWLRESGLLRTPIVYPMQRLPNRHRSRATKPTTVFFLDVFELGERLGLKPGTPRANWRQFGAVDGATDDHGTSTKQAISEAPTQVISCVNVNLRFKTIGDGPSPSHQKPDPVVMISERLLETFDRELWQKRSGKPMPHGALAALRLAIKGELLSRAGELDACEAELTSCILGASVSPWLAKIGRYGVNVLAGGSRADFVELGEGVKRRELARARNRAAERAEESRELEPADEGELLKAVEFFERSRLPVPSVVRDALATAAKRAVKP
jgi:hypothetical protein